MHDTCIGIAEQVLLDLREDIALNHVNLETEKCQGADLPLLLRDSVSETFEEVSGAVRACGASKADFEDAYTMLAERTVADVCLTEQRPRRFATKRDGEPVRMVCYDYPGHLYVSSSMDVEYRDSRFSQSLRPTPPPFSVIA